MATNQLKSVVFCMALVIAVVSGLQDASAQGLSLGDAAPALHIGEWVNGAPVQQFREGDIYVVEFSATWCPPCIRFVPHLAALAKRYSGAVTVVSVFTLSPFPEDPTGGKYRSAVRSLVDEMEADIAYAVAIDIPSGATAKAWGVRGVPHAVVIGRDGRVAWSGNPAKGLDGVLALLVSGATDLTAAIDAQEAFESALKAVDSLFRRDVHQGVRKMDSLIALYPHNPNLYAMKYRALAGSDAQAANEWLARMLAEGPDILDWVSISEDAWAASSDPDIDLAVLAKFRALLESPPTMHFRIVHSISNIYIRKSMLSGDPERRVRYLQMALLSCRNALRYCSESGYGAGVPEVHKRMETIQARIAKERQKAERVD